MAMYWLSHGYSVSHMAVVEVTSYTGRSWLLLCVITPCVFAGVSAPRGAGYLPAVADAHCSQLTGAIQRHGLHQDAGETPAPGCRLLPM